jgi:hypothetical protein
MKMLRELLPDALMLSGACAISFGAGQMYLPAGWIVAGGFAFGVGWLAARREGSD